MNRWELTEDVKVKFKPIIQAFLTKMENLTCDEVDNINNDEFNLELSDTELRPYTLLKLMEDFGYEKEDFRNNGWELDFWITIVKKGKSYPSTCERLNIRGCGMTFELNLTIEEI